VVLALCHTVDSHTLFFSILVPSPRSACSFLPDTWECRARFSQALRHRPIDSSTGWMDRACVNQWIPRSSVPLVLCICVWLSQSGKFYGPAEATSSPTGCPAMQRYHVVDSCSRGRWSEGEYGIPSGMNAKWRMPLAVFALVCTSIN
jgi:hypothetical protein